MSPDIQDFHHTPYRIGGVIRACVIIVLWVAAVLTGFLLPDPWRVEAMFLPFIITFLHTGLFITAHDAMHGGIAPQSRLVNTTIGWLCTRLYAMFPFAPLAAAHRDHHRFPASAQDPDYHDGVHAGFWRWYLRFLRHYITWRQIVAMALLYNLLRHVAGIPDATLLVFWVAPALVSTIQLFLFGTFLPHREPAAGYDSIHRSTTSGFRPWLSFVTCYHFGYHLEHHEAPRVPWWRLPDMARRRAAERAATGGSAS